MRENALLQRERSMTVRRMRSGARVSEASETLKG